MRSALLWCALGLFCIVPVTTSYATVEGQAVLPEPPRTLMSVLDQRLGALATRERQAARKTLLQDIRQFYAEGSTGPVWVDETGLRENARKVLEEVKKADDWGLDAKAFALPADIDATAGFDAMALAEIEMSLVAVMYASHARGGRINPHDLSLWLDHLPGAFDVAGFLQDIATSNDPAALLRSQHPQHPQFEALRQAYLAMKAKIESPAKADPRKILQPGPRIKVGEWHPDVIIVRERLGVPVEGDYQSHLDKKLAEAIFAFARKSGIKGRRVIDDRVRALLNRPPPAPKTADLDRIVANMERWRWVPRQLGDDHIWNNLPEYTTRFYKGGNIIHEERIIIGTVKNQTPIFSETMKFLVVHPEWGVPSTIKVRDLLPNILAGDYDVLRRRGMRVVDGSGKAVNPQRINWTKTDIRSVGIVQGSGRSNPLGQLKMMFPNSHDVYMHDTPQRELFNSSSRTYSAGCIRVRNPVQLAELILSEDKGWTANDINQMIGDRTLSNHRIDLDRPLPVHNVYFTVVADAQGQVKTFNDVYAHDRRVIDALKGRPMASITARDPARQQQRDVAEMNLAARERSRQVEDERSSSSYSWYWGSDYETPRRREDPWRRIRQR